MLRTIEQLTDFERMISRDRMESLWRFFVLVDLAVIAYFLSRIGDLLEVWMVMY